ncbi:MAG: metallopeptidase family protein [Pseudomonadota bacterium]
MPLDRPQHRDRDSEHVTPESFERVVWETLDSLPAWVREELNNIELIIQDLPGPELDPDGDGMLGLYLGTPLTERSIEDVGVVPDIIYLFRRPHLELGLPEADLIHEIRTTLIHEIAHFFGIDDDHLDEIGWG